MPDPPPEPTTSSVPVHAHEWEPHLAAILARQERDWALGRGSSVDALAEELRGTKFHQELLLELIHNELELREQAGDHPALAEYQQRYPELAELLQVQREIDLLIADDAVLDAAPTWATTLAVSDRYVLCEPIGQGAMGVVYRAWDTQLKRVVAIKLLRAGIDAADSDVVRFRQEAEAIARVRHPNIVQIHDITQLNGLPALAMEYCSGGSLASHIRGEILPPRVAAELILQVAQGVAAAHQGEIIHRDLKPGNVLLQWNGTPEESSGDRRPTQCVLTDPNIPLPTAKISDFGLAKLLTSDLAATATGSVMGTPAYMAPEQAWGDGKRIGLAADVYSVGAILYECLTGRPPFRGTTLSETLVQLRDQEPVFVRQLEPSVPVDLETIAHKCLRKEPHHRYSSAAALADDLTRFLHYRPITARRENWREAALRTFRRYPAASSLAIASILLLILIAAGSLVFAQRLHVARARSEKSERAARAGQAEALVGRAHGIRLSRRPGQRFEALAALRQAVEIGRDLEQPTDWFDPLRDEAIAALALPDAYVEAFRTEAEAVRVGTISDDGRRYAIAFATGDIRLRRRSDHRDLARIPRLDQDVLVHFIGNDRLLVTGQLSLAFELWDVSADRPRRQWSHETGCERFHVARDGKLLAVADRNEVMIIDVPTGKALAKLPTAPFSREPQIVLHPTHPLVMLHSYFRDEIHVRNWRTGEMVMQLRPGIEDDYPGYWGADWSPDGQRLVIINAHGDATHWYEFDAAEGQARLVRTDRPSREAAGGGSCVRFNSQGDRLLMLGWSHRLTLVDSYSGDALFRSQALNGLFAVCNLKLDPAGRIAGLFASPDQPQRFGVMSLASGYEYYPLMQPNDVAAANLSFDPTGAVVAVGVKDGIQLVATDTGDVLLRTTWNDFGAYDVCFDANGNLYVSGLGGFLRWPCRVTQGDRLRLELGCPERVHLFAGGGNVYLGTSDDGSVLAAGAWNGMGTQEYAGCWIKTAGEPAARKVLGQQSGTRCAVSPDGQYVALSTENALTRVVDSKAPTVAIQSFPGPSVPRFSRDGQWLLAGGGRVRSGTWQRSAVHDAGVSFDLSRDGTQILTCDSAGIIGLVEAESGRSLARLEGPEACAAPLCSPSGHLVLCRQQDAACVMFDLRRIRTQLKKFGLDWKSPPFPWAARAGAGSWEIVVAPELQNIKTADELLELVDRRAREKAEQNVQDGYAAFSAGMGAIRHYDLAQALGLLTRACERLPAAITPRQWRAYVQAEQRGFAGAIEDANWVLQRSDDVELRLLRAEWQFRLGRYHAAVADCSRVIESNQILARLAFGLRAECHAQLGDPDQAAADRVEFLNRTRNDPLSLDMAARPMVGPDISLRHPTIALLLAEKIRTLEVEHDRNVANTIGLALYRNDRIPEAVAWFEDRLAKTSDRLNATDLYVLAMAYQKLGDAVRAQDCLRRADDWKPKQELGLRQREQNRILRNEATSVTSSG